MELRQWSGKKKKEETAMARFKVEPNAEVKVDGAVLTVSELSVTFESPEVAAEVAELLRNPARRREALRLLSEAESSVKGFLEKREEALAVLSQMRVDPQGAFFRARAMWAPDDPRPPIDAVYSGYSALLGESLSGTTSFLATSEANLGTPVVERLFALTYVIGAVQDSVFEREENPAKQLAALQELGVTAQQGDLKPEKLAERLMLKAHPSLDAMVSARTGPR